jgi:hypothetical protein
MDIAGGFATAFLSIWLVERFSNASAEEGALMANPTHRFPPSSKAPSPPDLLEEWTAAD